MYKLILLIVSCLFSLSVVSYELDIKDFKKIGAVPITVKDANDRVTAKLMIKTDIKNIEFDSNLGIVQSSRDTNNGFYDVYLSPDEKKIVFYCDGYKRSEYLFPERPVSGVAYELTLLSTGKDPKRYDTAKNNLRVQSIRTA